jgi:hypothetical protein
VSAVKQAFSFGMQTFCNLIAFYSNLIHYVSSISVYDALVLRKVIRNITFHVNILANSVNIHCLGTVEYAYDIV